MKTPPELANHRSWTERAADVLPGGVNSPVRSFAAVDCEPLIIERASGCRVTDIQGREFLDYIGSWGPLIHGHNHPVIRQAVIEALSRGSSYGLTSTFEIALAEEIRRRMPSIESVRLVSSGTEAAMAALRLARAYTLRPRFIKFAGCYHGHADAFLVAAGSGAATLGVPNSAGVAASTAAECVVVPFNDISAVEARFREHRSEIAAVILEPVAANMGLVPPVGDFLGRLRQLCDRYQALLIFDEVITGFRLSVGGAQEFYGVRPDLTVLGKIIGGGFPVGAFGGRAEIMKMLAPTGPVYQAGTLSGNPAAAAAGCAALSLLTADLYHRLSAVTEMLQTGLERILHGAGIPAAIQRAGSLLTLFFSRKPVLNFDDAQSADHRLYARFFNGMLRRGILLPPSGFEAWFISSAHTNAEIELTLTAAEKVVAEW